MTIIGHPGAGFQPLGPTELLETINEAAEMGREKDRERARREQCIARVQNMFRMSQGRFGPQQWAYVDALQRQVEAGTTPQKKGNVGHPSLGPATGRFRMGSR